MTLPVSPNSPGPSRLTPSGIALIYAVFAVLWIITSGYLLTLTVSDPLLQSRIEIAKGLAFVVVTSALLYLLLRRWHTALVNALAQSNRSLEESKLKDAELVTLLEVSQELTATLDLQRVLQTTTDRVTELSELKSAAVYLLDGETLRLWATTPPLPPEFPEELRNAPLADHPHIREAIATGMPVFLPDTATADLTPAELAVAKLRDLRSILYLPLLAGTKVMGTLIVTTVGEPKKLSQAQTDLCRALANIAALAVENARLYESSQHYAVELEQRIAACKHAEAAQQEALQRLQKIARQLPGVVYQFRLRPDGSSCLPYASDGLRELFRVSPDEVVEDASRVFAKLPPEDYESVMTTIQASARDLSQWCHEFRVAFNDGTVRWLLGNAMPQREADGSVLWHGFATDITEHKKHENELKKTKESYDFATSAGKVGTWDWNPVTGNVIWNDETFRILGFVPGAVSPSYELFLEMVHQEDRSLLDSAVQEALHQKKPYSLDCRIVRGNGVERICHAAGKVEFDKNDQPIRMMGTFQDITERKQAEEKIRQLAHFDSLTGLPNRTLLNDRISQAISMAQRSQDNLAVMFVDLDHFKNINDTLGHLIGDELLKEVAKRMRSIMREEDTISRLGGDEFILLLPGTDADGAAQVAEKLLWAVAQHYQIAQHELIVTPSIGIAMYPGDGEDFDTLSKRADAAMYRAKHDGRNNYRFFTSEMQQHSARNLQLGNALRRVLERDQLHLHYQPQISLESGRIIGVEALLRWHHPEMGMISPAEFIPVAEDSGLILPIGEWVLRSAVRQLKSWMDSGIAQMVMAVNLSAVQFRHSHLPELVSQILREEGVPPQLLELELTEGVAMDDPLGAIAIMNNLHARGVRMSIDDFGTGYSSLSYLKRFQVYKLKIDQSFVRDITEDPEDKAIVAAIISMAGSLGMQIIAEGVETEGQLEFLREKDCNEVQGYYFSKPLPADQFEAFVRKSAIDLAR